MAAVVTNVLFPCPASSYTIDSFPGELVWVSGVAECGGEAHGSSLCKTVPCLLLPYESARFIFVFFHSNAEDLGRCRWFCHFLREQFQVHVLAVEYPGYGVCTGTASSESVLANAHAALRFVTEDLKLPLDQVKLFGRSIGTGPALQLAARFKVAGLILVTPFLSVKELFQDRIGPLSIFIDEWFQNEDAIKEVHSPTMIIHGRRDVIIPWHHSDTLFKLCPARKVFVNPELLEHNTNLTTDITYFIVPMFRFFALPDYSFQELQVPAWAFDKRRSPFYVRPAMEVCSHRSTQVRTGRIALPEGDEDEAPIEQDLGFMLEPFVDLPGDDLRDGADTGVAILTYSNVPLLTQPTVLHTYNATKQSYDFRIEEDRRQAWSDLGSEDHPSDIMRAAWRINHEGSLPKRFASCLPPSGAAGANPETSVPCSFTLQGASRGYVVIQQGKKCASRPRAPLGQHAATHAAPPTRKANTA